MASGSCVPGTPSDARQAVSSLRAVDLVSEDWTAESGVIHSSMQRFRIARDTSPCLQFEHFLKTTECFASYNSAGNIASLKSKWEMV